MSNPSTPLITGYDSEGGMALPGYTPRPMDIVQRTASKTPVPNCAFEGHLAINMYYIGIDPSDHDVLDAKIETSGDKYIKQTDKFHHSAYSAAAAINTLYSEDTHEFTEGRSYDDLADRSYFSPGGVPIGVSGAAVVLDVDFLGSPWRMPDVLSERFSLDPVLKAGFLPFRRPGSAGGIVHHPSRKATLRVMNIDGTCKYATTDFMLDGVKRLIEEDYRPAPGFEENMLQLYGEKFKLYSFSIKMLNSANFDWQRSWDKAWKDKIRASALAGARNRCYILTGAKIYGGYPVRYTNETNSKSEPLGTMNVVMFMTDDEPLPTMRRIETKSGLVYFKWYPKTGTTLYSSEAMNFSKQAPEYDSEIEAGAGESTEYIDPDGEE